MIKTRSHKIHLCLVLIFTVLCHFGLGETIFSGYVWCFGTNGHFAMEPAGHHHDAKTAPIALNKQAATYQSGSKRSDCVDVSVSDGDQACSPKPIKDLFKLPVFPLGLAFCLFFINLSQVVSTNRIPFLRYRPFIDSGQLALRTTVLLN
jgi:hypothetical protein